MCTVLKGLSVFRDGTHVLLVVLSLVIDNKSCLDWRDVRKGASDMNEEEAAVVGQVIMFGLQIALVRRVRKIAKSVY
jgi:hypothetical protein